MGKDFLTIFWMFDTYFIFAELISKTTSRLSVNMFCMAKFSMLHGFTKGVSVNVLYF